MKIYILPVPSILRPSSQPFVYPRHNADFGVEQDFFAYSTRQKKIFVNTPAEADWHYLPVFWTRWHLNHDYAKSGLDDLQRMVDKIIIDDKKTFTICQYDDGPIADIGKAVVFLASRKTDIGRDIPLVSTPHRTLFIKPAKKYRACFLGRAMTHPIRQEMVAQLNDRDDVYIFDGNKGERFFTRKMFESYIALCPRGYGGSSFRFFEAMQLGIVPFLIGDRDTRPFKKFIPWDEISFYSKTPTNIAAILDSVSNAQLRSMGKKAAQIWREKLIYQKWCSYVIKDLDDSP